MGRVILGYLTGPNGIPRVFVRGMQEDQSQRKKIRWKTNRVGGI